VRSYLEAEEARRVEVRGTPVPVLPEAANIDQLALFE
jgi:hypothetical protein